MNIKKTILSPVNREDFAADFSSKSNAVNVLVPEDVLGDSIAHVKRFAVGRYCWFVANAVTGMIQNAGGMVEQMTSIPLSSFANSNPERLFLQMHPQDMTHMFAFTNYWVSYFMGLSPERKMNVYPTIYIRLKNEDELYKWVTVQYVDNIVDTEGNILYGLTVISDISHIKKEGPTKMSILDSDEGSCLHFLCNDTNGVQISNEKTPRLTAREVEILQYLAIINSSKEIAGELNISVNTINNHRQSMLIKTITKSTAELVNYAIRAGFI